MNTPVSLDPTKDLNFKKAFLNNEVLAFQITDTYSLTDTHTMIPQPWGQTAYSILILKLDDLWLKCWFTLIDTSVQLKWHVKPLWANIRYSSSFDIAAPYACCNMAGVSDLRDRSKFTGYLIRVLRFILPSLKLCFYRGCAYKAKNNN